MEQTFNSVMTAQCCTPGWSVEKGAKHVFMTSVPLAFAILLKKWSQTFFWAMAITYSMKPKLITEPGTWTHPAKHIVEAWMVIATWRIWTNLRSEDVSLRRLFKHSCQLTFGIGVWHQARKTIRMPTSPLLKKEI